MSRMSFPTLLFTAGCAGCVWPYLVGQVEGCNAQRPEAAEHGEYAETQVVPGRHHEKVVFALCITGVVALQERMEG